VPEGEGGVSGLDRRLARIEDEARKGEVFEDEHERAKRLKRIREAAEHTNRCRDKDEPPIFEITESGDVLCACDGKPVTDYHQTLAEQFYWMEVGWGSPGLVHDEEAQAFYTPERELALSRDRVDLRLLMGEERGEAWTSREGLTDTDEPEGAA
jgi:hypothetical protein